MHGVQPGGKTPDLDKMPQLYEGWKPVCGPAYNLKGIKWEISVFILFLKLCFSFNVAHGMVGVSPVVVERGTV